MIERETTIHLDNSICKLRKTKPIKSDIAKYWKDKIFELGIFVDWGEPACWACGFYEFKHDVVNKKTSLDECFLTWNKETYLERCHVVPVALGGCSCHGNLVLLCKQCHKSNPDTDNVKLFLRWMKNKRRYGDRRYNELKIAFDEFGLKLNNLNFYLFCNEEFIRYFKANSIPVGYMFTDASRIACLIEWKKMFSQSELLNKIPSYIRDIIEDQNKNGS